MGGTVSGVPRARTGIVVANGNGNLGWSLLSTAGGGLSACAIGSYSVGTNGRVVASLPLVSNNMIFYLISPGSAYAIQVDSGTQIVGGVANQNHLVTPFIPGI